MLDQCDSRKLLSKVWATSAAIPLFGRSDLKFEGFPLKFEMNFFKIDLSIHFWFWHVGVGNVYDARSEGELQYLLVQKSGGKSCSGLIKRGCQERVFVFFAGISLILSDLSDKIT